MDAENFRITTNGLWFRVEWLRDKGPPKSWTPVHLPECYSNLQNRFDTFEEAKKTYDYLVAGGRNFVFTQVWPR